LLHSDRLNNLGKMASSMAHELRNPLFAIDGFLKIIRADLSKDSLLKVKPYLDIIKFREKQWNGRGFCY
jgi:two-component system, sporulation sensor kinase D